MTVKELKEKLSAYPDDMPVIIYDEYYGDDTVECIGITHFVTDDALWVDALRLSCKH